MKWRHGILLTCLSLLFFTGTGISQDVGFGKNKVQYRAYDWSYIQTSNFDIYYYADGYDLAVFAAEVLENAYTTISDQLRYQLQKRVPVIVYRSPNEFQQTNVISELIEENVGGFTEAFKNRVVIPFNGSYEDFRHVLHHELTHAVIFDMLYGNILHSVFSPQALFNLPLWFSEGYAEYSSRYGMDYQADMVLRDATINNYLYPLSYVGGYLAYKQGQAVLTYIADRYGEEKISEVLRRGRSKLSISDGLKAAIGLSEEELNEEWQMALKKQYWPELAKRKIPKDFAKQLTFHEKDGSFYNEKPVFSPQGDRLAIFSDRSDFTEIYIISTIDGHLIDRVVKGERSGDLESLHSYVSGMSWSPDGKSLAFISKSKGEDALVLVNVQKKKIYKKLKFKMSAMFSPAWGPSGDLIAFAGVRDSQEDIFVYNLKSQNLEKLTDDQYSDIDPNWSPDGARLVFSSDRPKEESESSADSATFRYGRYDLYLLDFSTQTVSPLGAGSGMNRQPSWSPQGDRIAYISNRNGIDNIYVHELETGRTFPVTDILTGCFNPSWSKEGDQLAFSCFYKGGWDVFIMKEIFHQTAEGEQLAPTPFVQGISYKAIMASTIDSLSTQADSAQAARKDPGQFSSYVFRSKEPYDPNRWGEQPDSIADSSSLPKETKSDTLAYRLPDGEYKQNKYKLKFTPDLVGGAFGYDPFYGLVGQSYLAFSDIMGNHNLLLAFDVFNSIDQTNIQLFYSYTARRTDYYLGALHTKYFYLDNFDRIFSDRVFGSFFGASRPFSKFSRMDLGVTFLGIDRKFEVDDEFNANPSPFVKKSRKALFFDISLINDTILWGLTGPVNGTRYRLTFEYAPQVSTSGLAYRSAWFDYRKYIHFIQRFNFAFRLTAGSSWGKEPRMFFLGGTSNWIYPDFVETEIYDLENLYFSGTVVPLRGYDMFEFSGRNFTLFNFEFRYPFIDQLAFRFPLGIRLSQVNGVLFLDAGAAWNENAHFKGGTTAGSDRLEDIKTAFGFGARANLGFLILRFDTAWKTDFADVSKPRYYFSLGADF